MRPKTFLSFNRRLFLSVLLLFTAFAACTFFFQYQREKRYKSDLLNLRLQTYNEQLHEYIENTHGIFPDSLNRYVAAHIIPNLRVTIIDGSGKVLYDNTRHDWKHMSNHLNRKEVQEALINGSGYAVSRHSESLQGEAFFYSAQYYSSSRLIIRSALPYTVSLIEHLRVDPATFWIMAVICILLLFIFFRFTHRLGLSLTQLQQFATQADRDEAIDLSTYKELPNNELGVISRHIMQIYGRLHRAKQALTIEREKLILHLQIAHEGLGIFDKSKEEILVNNLFTRYVNIISDINLTRSADVFQIPEFIPITRFLNEQNHNTSATRDLQRHSYQIQKNAHIFAIECILFQDRSFEISINDITHTEEQARLKRQLTQNIAHELKTPVSSIQGYLETILNNPGLDVERRQTFLERSYAQSNRLTTLLQDISTLARLDETSSMIDKEPVNLTLLVSHIFEEVSMALEERQMTVDNQLKEPLVIQGNPSLLYSIFRNLTDNALAYAGAQTRITLKCFREENDCYYFSFSDSGAGVSDEHLNRLFERFYRVDKGRSRKQGGTGLGLSIVKNAIVFHGGTIFAKHAPGGGLEFIFTLRK